MGGAAVGVRGALGLETTAPNSSRPPLLSPTLLPGPGSASRGAPRGRSAGFSSRETPLWDSVCRLLPCLLRPAHTGLAIQSCHRVPEDEAAARPLTTGRPFEALKAHGRRILAPLTVRVMQDHGDLFLRAALSIPSGASRAGSVAGGSGGNGAIMSRGRELSSRTRGRPAAGHKGMGRGALGALGQTEDII